MQNNTHIVISGQQGIGKTTLAYALVREYEINYCCRIPYFAMTKIPTSLKEIFDIIALAFSIKPLYKEPIELRINSVLKSSQIYYLLLDNYPNTHDNTLQTMLKIALQRLPMLRVIITSRQVRQFSQLDNLVEETLEPLNDIDFQSPAFQIFARVLRAHGSGESLFTTTHLKQCQLAQGNPFNLLLIANMYVNHQDFHSTTQAITQIITTLSLIELHIIEFITLCRKKVTVLLLTYYIQQLAITETQMQETLHQLVTRGIIAYTCINGMYTYTIHDVLMQAFLNFENHSLVAHQKLHQILRRLIAIVTPFDAGTIPIFTRDDIQILIELTHHILDINENQVVLVMKLLVAYELVWIHYASAAQVIVIAESCIAKCTVPHPVTYKLYKLLGNLYKYRANETATYYFTKAVNQFHHSGETLEWALTMLDFSFNLGKTQLSSEHITATQTTLSIFQEHDMQYAHARGLDCLSRIYLQQGDITKALTYSQQAINEFAGMTNTVGYIDALIHKALVYMVLNDYEIARQLFTQVIHTTDINHWTHLNAVAKLRMAATLMFDADLIHARQYLAQAADVIIALQGIPGKFCLSLTSIVSFCWQKTIS
jgi:GTPase SAR1 family protein